MDAELIAAVDSVGVGVGVSVGMGLDGDVKVAVSVAVEGTLDEVDEVYGVALDGMDGKVGT